MGFHSCLSAECSYKVFDGFQIEFYTEIKNVLVVQGHHI